MNYRVESKIRARQLIKGKAFGVFLTMLGVELILLIPTILISIAMFVVGIIDINSLESSTTSKVFEAVDTIVSFVMVLISIPVQVGLVAKFISVARGGEARDVSAFFLFKEKKTSEVYKANFLVALYVLLGTICLIIPGIIISLRYAFLSHVFCDNPNLTYREAMEKSRQLTKGRKGQIFFYHFSFFGWYLLVLVTFGIASIYVIPYENVAFASYYSLCASENGDTINRYATYGNNDPYEYDNDPYKYDNDPYEN